MSELTVLPPRHVGGATSPPPPTAKPTPLSDPATEGVAGFFGTLIDIINPLQHIPIVSNIYRAATGDTMSPAANILGGGLFGGFIGAGISAAGEAIEQATGDDLATTLHKAGNAIAGTSTNQPLGTPLVGDQGQAAALLAAQEVPPAPPIAAAAAPAGDGLSLEPYKNRTLNLEKAEMGQQLASKLDAIALAM